LPLDSFSVKKRTESASKLMIINEYKEFLEKNVSSRYESKNPLKQFVVAWNRGISSIPEEIWRLFKYYYLDENKPSLKSCNDRVHVTAIEKEINLPSVSAFERVANNIPKPVLVRWRDGAKAFKDLCMPYISRDYTSFKSNQIWVTDHHIFDQFVIGPYMQGIIRILLICCIFIPLQMIYFSAKLITTSSRDHLQKTIVS
jgi:hypothetical protein